MTPVEAGGHVTSRLGLITACGARETLAGRLCARLMVEKQWARVLLFNDIFVASMASSIALFADAPVRASTLNRWLAAIFPVLVVAMMRARRSPDTRLNISLLDTFTYVLGVVSLAAMLVVWVQSVAGVNDPLSLAPRLWVFNVVYLGVARATLVSARHQAMRTRGLARPTLVIGAGVIGAHLVKRLIDEPGYGLRPVGFIDADPLPAADPLQTVALPVLGGLDDLPAAIAQTGARHVIVAFSGDRDHALIATVRQCQGLGIGVSLVPRLYEAINERTTLDHVGGLPVLTLQATNPLGWQFTVKHGLDRSFASLALLVLSPVMAACALAVRLSSAGPVLFRQRRVGRDGHEFTMFKFRTMRGDPAAVGEADASWAALIRGEEPVFSSTAAASRVTRVGQLLRLVSLDELPQLFNVLNGDMSLVGPRPERVNYVREFERVVHRYGDRHRVKSGITGWAQVNGLRGQTSIADRVEWDNYYIQNWSLWLDLRIIALTIGEILRFRG